MKYNCLVILVIIYISNICANEKKQVPLLRNGYYQYYSPFSPLSYVECSKNCVDCREGSCAKCQKGLYLYGNSCYESCPFETLADNISLSCKRKEENPVYIKAYTISRCVNSCGKTFGDCSCNPRCTKSGDCCSDYQICEIISESHTNNVIIPNCKFSTVDKAVCLQCKDNFYYYQNQCVKSCPVNTLTNEENNLCIEREGCDADMQTNSLCQKCKNGKCAQCINGYYLYEGNCLKTCPVGLRADRINYTCQPKAAFSFYWIFPSKYGCKDKCGYHDIQLDCSCRHTCLRRGNCCDNFEKECMEQLEGENCKICDSCVNGQCVKCKDLAVLNGEGQCTCMEGYEYDIEEDVCQKTTRENNTQKPIQSEFKTLQQEFTIGKNQEEEKKISTEQEKPLLSIKEEKPSINEEKKPVIKEEEEEEKKLVMKTEEKKPVVKEEEEEEKKLVMKTEEKKPVIKEEEITEEKELPKEKRMETNIKKSKVSITFLPTPNQIEQKLLNISRKNNQTEKNTLTFFKDSNSTIIAKYDNNFQIDANLHELIRQELQKSFQSILSQTKAGGKNQTQILNLYMNGNISINVLTGNTNPQLVTQNIYNRDSFNTHNNKVVNLDSLNQIQKKVEVHPGDSSNKKNNIPRLNNRMKQYRVLPKQEHGQNFTQAEMLAKKFNMDSSVPAPYAKIEEQKKVKAAESLTSFYANDANSLNMERSLKSVTSSDPLSDSTEGGSHNTYYIHNHSIQVFNSTNPSMISLTHANGNETRKEVIIINNNGNCSRVHSGKGGIDGNMILVNNPVSNAHSPVKKNKNLF